MLRKTSVGTLICLFAVSLCASSCGGEAQSAVSFDTAPAAETAPVVTEAVTENPLDDDLPELDFGGKEFHVRSVTYDPASYLTLFDTEAENGDVVMDSIYRRNRAIEERFHMSFVSDEDSYSNNYTLLKKSAISGDPAYDLIQCINREAFQAGLDGYLMPMDMLTYLDLDKPYYSKDINDQLKINGKLLFAYSDECIQMFESAMVMVFNQKMTADLDLTSPYELVRAGTWTYDALKEYLKAGCYDLDGDGKFVTGSDRFGLISNEDFLIPNFWISAGVYSVTVNGEGIPYFNALGNDRFVASLSICTEWMQEDGLLWFYPVGDRQNTLTMFMNEQAFFAGTAIGRLAPLRDMGTDFGLIPYPKYEAEQEKYYNRVIDGWLHVVPVSAEEPEFISAVMEALASETAKTVFPSYYEKALTQKVLRDEASVEMMELVRQNRCMDLGDVPLMDTVRQNYVNAVIKGKSDIESLSSSQEKKINKKLDSIIESLRNAEG